jgi:translocation and assembly module TamA
MIRELLGNEGFPFARVKGEAVVRLAGHSAEVTFTVDPGLPYYFGRIDISGHEGYVKPTVIKRSLAFQPGEQYAARALDESRRNLFDLRVFQTAVIEPGKPDQNAHTVPVNIRVKPRKQHNVQLGIGYGTEDGLRLRGAWSYRNLSGHADRFSISAKRSDLKETFQGEYFFPYFLSARNSLTVNSGYERDKAEFYTLRKLFGTADLLHRLGKDWTARLGYGFTSNRPENIDVSGIDGEYEINEDYRISNMRLELERNTVANDLNPSDGKVFRIGVEKASRYMGSEIDYTRPGLEARAYLPLPWQLVLAGRLRMSYIEAAEDTDEIPIFKQLFLGGSKTVRGYAYQQLGVVDSDDNVIAAGGLSSLNANIELRYPIYKKFSGVAFVDMGVLDNESFRYNLNRMRYTCGLGLRYDTVIGPVQVDLGYKLNPPDNAKTSDPEVQSLANPDRWRLHINVGQAF